MIILRQKSFGRKADSFGFRQELDHSSKPTISKNGKLVTGEEADKAFQEFAKPVINNRNRFWRNKPVIYKDKNGLQTHFEVSEVSRNPFNQSIYLEQGTTGHFDAFNRKINYGAYSSDPKEAFKELLKLRRELGYDDEKIPKELKDQIRKIARKKKLQRGAIYSAAALAATGAGVGLYKHQKNKKNKKNKDDNT